MSTRASLRALRVSVLAHLRGRECSGFLRVATLGVNGGIQGRTRGIDGHRCRAEHITLRRPHPTAHTPLASRKEIGEISHRRERLAYAVSTKSAGAICACGGASGAYVFAVRCAAGGDHVGERGKNEASRNGSLRSVSTWCGYFHLSRAKPLAVLPLDGQRRLSPRHHP